MLNFTTHSIGTLMIAMIEHDADDHVFIKALFHLELADNRENMILVQVTLRSRATLSNSTRAHAAKSKLRRRGRKPARRLGYSKDAVCLAKLAVDAKQYLEQ
jgi:hypothetical protein